MTIRFWRRFDGDTPLNIVDQRPSSPRLGEHRCKTTTMDNGSILVVCFNNNTVPEYYCVLPHPEVEFGNSR